ncbi:MAG: hypothetical protein K9L30_19260 [Desulfobacterales bacterium]|nr:hypothetical protein [Desulfobacterales bacterium]
MDRCYSIERNNDIIQICFFKKPNKSELKEAMNDVLAQGDCLLRLWELKKGIVIDNSQIEEIAQYGEEIWPVPSKAAIVAPDDLSFGLSRVHDVYRDQNKRKTMVFRTKQEAIKWLKEDS